MRIFICEDEINFRPRNAILKALEGHDLTVATTKDEAIAIYKGGYDLLLLDHDMRGLFDLSSHPSTAYHFVTWLVAQPFKKKPRVILHSQNPEGRNNMRRELIKGGFRCVSEFPFSPSYVDYLLTI